MGELSSTMIARLGLDLRDVVRAMIHCARFGSGKHVLELDAIKAMAARTS